jgi:hypothetical protein
VYADARQLNENLNQAMRSRATIDYAVGILMAQGGRSPEDAFQLLVRASQRENRKLRDFASQVVQGASHGPSLGCRSRTAGTEVVAGPTIVSSVGLIAKVAN